VLCGCHGLLGASVPLSRPYCRLCAGVQAGNTCPVCAKSVKPRQRKRTNGEGSEDEAESEEEEGAIRPERQRRWDHLRKIHHVSPWRRGPSCTSCWKLTGALGPWSICTVP
jgi:hypothetical protein